MKASNPSHAFGMVLADELTRLGLRHAVIAPGARSTPIVLGLADEQRIAVHVQIDERSAAFTALGIARATGVAAAVVCTSGTAAANFHPAVVEASVDRVPLLVLTADRPPELRGAGANQTIDQVKLYGDAVRWFCEVGVPEENPDAPRYWRSLAGRAWAEATGRPPGPVHLNIPLREPLAPSGDSYPHDLSGRPDDAPWTPVVRADSAPASKAIELLTEMVGGAERGVVLAGAGPRTEPEPVLDFATRAGYPLLAEPGSGLRRGPLAISTAEALLRAGFGDDHRPDLVIRIGKTGLSRALAAWLDDDTPQVVVDPHGAWIDPERRALHVLEADAASLLAATRVERRETAWTHTWTEAESRARAAVDAVLDSSGISEPRTARDLVRALPPDAALVVAASMPVRDVDWFMEPRDGLTVAGNRGANGIDGVVSTALGVALGRRGPTAALLGDLALLHDQNGLLLTRAEAVDLALVVVNNDGGGIFSLLRHHDHPEFERLFVTPHGVAPADLARLYRVPHVRIDDPADLGPAIRGPGVRIVEVPTDRAATAEVHRACWEAVGRVL